jgi:hypothetical protein
VFDDKFDFKSAPTIDKLPHEKHYNLTKIRLLDLVDEKLSIPENLKKLRDDIFVELLPKFLLLNRKFSITFRSKQPGVEIQTITEKDIPKLKSKTFEMSFDLQKEPSIIISCFLYHWLYNFIMIYCTICNNQTVIYYFS